MYETLMIFDFVQGIALIGLLSPPPPPELGWEVPLPPTHT